MMFGKSAERTSDEGLGYKQWSLTNGRMEGKKEGKKEKKEVLLADMKAEDRRGQGARNE